MKTVIFLGAGASAADGAPLQSRLFRDYFDYVRTSQSGSSTNMKKELIVFFNRFFGVDLDHQNPRDISFPTFEEVLGTIDLGINRNEAFKDYGLDNIKENNNRLRHIRVYLILLMAKIIKEKLKDWNKFHNRLICNLKSSQLLDDVGFISTNYDILIDNALSKERINDANYGIDCFDYSSGRLIRHDESGTALFKIHGSLNWLYCSVCNSVTCTPYEKGIVMLIDFIEHATCRKCESLFSPIIVPPTYFKDMTNVFLNQIWYKAEQLLKDAEHVIFCGYSFPDADIHIKYLLKRVQTSRKDRDVKFTVINDHLRKSVHIKNEEENRYKRFLGHHVNYTDSSFEQFCENPRGFI